MYYLRVDHLGVTAYKIGITNRSVEERFAGVDLTKITVIKIWNYSVGVQARKAEQKILRQQVGPKYSGPGLLRLEGHSEMFDRDVLGLDNSL